jgi:hypothetical protein
MLVKHIKHLFQQSNISKKKSNQGLKTEFNVFFIVFCKWKFFVYIHKQLEYKKKQPLFKKIC